MDLRSKADLRREIARLESLVDKLEGARVAQEELIERLLREACACSVGTCTESFRPDLPGFPLDCSLLHGHTGKHRTEDGAEWFVEGPTSYRVTDLTGNVPGNGTLA